jgi:hypothetical protein
LAKESLATSEKLLKDAKTELLNKLKEAKGKIPENLKE